MNINKFGLLAVIGAGAAALTVASRAATDPPAVQVAQAKPAAPAKLPAPVDPHAGHSHAAPAPAVVHSGPPGKAQVDEMVFDAGTVERGTDIKHDFKIKNVGENPLTVDAKPG